MIIVYVVGTFCLKAEWYVPHAKDTQFAESTRNPQYALI